MTTRINYLFFFIAILCIASVITPGGAVPNCYGYCKAGPLIPDDGCVQLCKRFDEDAVCKNGMCCCALRPPPPRM
ncbi:LCR-like protein [Medicago truncatula]|uniref:LCR-like protein n=1 Tax=Medicago truncatula TaxID=3880 RepID=A0A072V954_MEDTR|nr:LCR-like protein [Medicago truncatula]